MSAIISILALASLALAVPHNGAYGYGDPAMTLSTSTTTTSFIAQATVDPSSSCSEGTTVSCCNSQIGGGLLGDVLGGSCSLPNLAVLGVTTGSQCPGANTYCCPTTQTGDLDINAACLPLAL